MASVSPMQHGNHFTRADLDHLIESTLVEQVEFHDEIDSTNNRALELARQGTCDTPLLVLAEHQNEGRGRGSNQWWAGPGALTFSLMVETEAMRIPPKSWPQASLTVGLAVCEAIEEFLDEPTIQLKWPNDVYVRRRKLCGILIELPPEQRQLMVVGIGINVNNSLRDAPPELQSTAIALCDAVGREFSMVDVLQRVLVLLQDRLDWIGSRDDELRSRWRQRCMLTERVVHIDLGSRQVAGLCRGIDDEGALLIETAGGIERCFAGVVTKF